MLKIEVMLYSKTFYLLFCIIDKKRVREIYNR